MTGDVFDFLYEPFAGTPDRLAEYLQPFAVEVRQSRGFWPCTEYRDGDGRRVREVGDITVYAGDRIRVGPRSDATPQERVVLLRAAERVVLAGSDGSEEPGWERRVTDWGAVYRKCTVMVYLDQADGRPSRAATAALDMEQLRELELWLLADGEAA